MIVRYANTYSKSLRSTDQVGFVLIYKGLDNSTRKGGTFRNEDTREDTRRHCERVKPLFVCLVEHCSIPAERTIFNVLLYKLHSSKLIQ